jgi:hypothetical protein
MPRRLALLCASNSDGVNSFYTEPCSRGRCYAYENGACTAGTETAEVFEKWFTPTRDANLPSCPISKSCMWDITAVTRGEVGCVVRRLGMLCEHQGGEWNTWQMAEPDDPVWGEP